jgi:hypothetical protein
MRANSSVINYKSLNINNVKFTVPEKIKGKYISYIANDQGSLYVQTPTMTVHKIDSDDGYIQFRIRADSPFVQLLNDFDDHCANYLSQNSAKFFNGKVFSKLKITNAYLPLYRPLYRQDDSHEHDQIESLNENQNVEENVEENNVGDQHETKKISKKEQDYIITFKFNDSILIKDQRDVVRDVTDIESGTTAIAVIDMEHISIGKSSIQPIFTLQQMKIYVKEKLTNWCIQQDSDDEEEPIIDEKDVLEQISILENAEATCASQREARKQKQKQKQTEKKTITGNNENNENNANNNLKLTINDDEHDFF